MRKLSFSTLGCPDWSWRDILEKGPRFGFDGVEIRLLERETDLLQRPEFAASQRAARRRELDSAGFQVCGLASSVRFDEPEREQRAARLSDGFRYLDLARELGAKFVRVFGDVLPKNSDDAAMEAVVENIAEGLQKLGERAETVGVGVVIETHGDFADSRRMQDLMQRVTSPSVGLLWDTHHPWRFFGEELSASFERLKPWIRHTHWKDSVARANRATTGESSVAESQAHALMSGHKPADYVLFGGGEFPIPEALSLLDQIAYDGWFSLEWEKMWHPEIEAPEIALPLFASKMRMFERLLRLE